MVEEAVQALLLEEEAAAEGLILDLAVVLNSLSEEFYWEVAVEVLVMVVAKMVVEELY